MPEAGNEAIYRIDLTSRFSPAARPQVADIEAVTDPEDLVLKEHFEDFRSRFTNTNKQLVGRVFNRLIDDIHTPYVRLLRHDDKPTPFPGLIAVRREDEGIEPYPQNAAATDYRSLRLANFAIRAGSLVSIEQTVKQRQDGPLFQIFTLSLIDKLKGQLPAQ